MLRLPAERLRRLLRLQPIVVQGRELDLQTQLLLWIQSKSKRMPLHKLSVSRARHEYRLMRKIFEDPLHDPPATDRTIASEAGPIPLRVYGAKPAQAEPAIVFFHGGGGVIGDLDTHDGACRRLARATGVRVFAVDYRLAPEHPFPAGLHDAIAAFRWVHAHAAELHVDADRIAVAGDSMGANFAASLCIECRGGPSPCFQLLVYPGTDYVNETESRRLLGRGFFLDRRTIEWFNAHYFGDADMRDPRASILLAPDLRDLPPAHVVTAGFDPLRDEGHAYARALEVAGNACTYREYPSLVHTFVQMTGVSRAAAEAIDDFGGTLRRALSRV